MKVSDKYKEVQRLIEVLDYNQAINLLVDIVKENPEEMEKAQGMIQDIRQKKEEFNDKYEELIRVLFDENDYQKGLEIIDELEQLDKNPNPSTEDTIRDARISAELIYFRLLFNEAMDRAYGYYQAGQYNEAVSTYLTAYNFHKRTYDERDYGDLIKGPVDKSLEKLMAATAEFLSSYENMSGLTAQGIVTPSARTSETLGRARELISRFAELRNTVWHAGWTFREQNRLLGEISSEYKEDFFLGFAWRIVYGRTTVEQNEGLVVAMDGFWESTLNPIINQIDRNLENSLTRAESSYRAESWVTAQESYEESEYWAEQALSYNTLRSDIMNLDESMALNDKSRDILNIYYDKLVDLNTKYDHARLFAVLSQFNDRLESYRVYNNKDYPLMTGRRSILKEEIENLVPQRDSWKTLEDTIGRDNLYKGSSSGELAAFSLDRIEQVIDSYGLLRGQIALDMAEYVLNPLETEYKRILDEQANALELLEGITPEELEDDLNILYVYPRRSLNLLEILSSDNLVLQENIQEFLDDYRNIREDVPQKDPMDRYLQRGESILAGLKSAGQEYGRITRRADQNLVLAERFLNEAEYRFAESEDALGRKSFAQAIQELTTSQDLFVQALSYDEDIIARDEVDRRIADLQAEILLEENKEVIRYVRENVNQGKSLYLQGRYAQSEIVLLRAESRWFTTNTEPNSEINYWLNLVRAALSVESGRTIEDTEPLYAEMTQFLNLAYSNFETGKKLIEEGNTAEGFKYLDRSDQNLNEILIPMPLNQAASVLKLRIQQLRDPDLFIVVFSEKYKSARSKLQTEPDEAYIDLKDLSAIEPDYPGIAKAIYDAEIILGIRIPPPDTRALKESQDLYQKAFAIVEGNVRSQFPVALAQLDKAIELNPENSRAIELKDRIQLDAGGQTTIVLSSAAQSQFKSAEEKYIKGDYFEAYAIVQQLLKDKDNATYPPLQDLKRRLESKF